MLEAKAKMDDNSFVSGSGSVHGITCGATFFFEFTDLTIGDNNLVMTGTIVATNMATRFGIHNFYGMWIGSEVQVTSNLDGSNMHFMLPIYGIDFSGSGRVVI